MKKRIFFAVLILLMAAAETQAQTLTKALKQDSEVNPILPFNLCADPTAVEYDGRLYVYGTNDQQEYDITKDKTKNTYGQIKQLVCMSTADMVNWTYHGVIDVKSASTWIATSWAPSIVSREESDGKTHFYLYYTNTASGIGVLTATSPLGPWRDPLGHALIDWRTPGRGEQSNIIDPGVCIDDKGDAYITFGGGDPNKNGSTLMPGNARIAKLGKNMISIDGAIKSIPAPFHFEANELNYINGKYVFSYSGGWACNAGDWSKYSGKGSYGCPGNCSILSMTTEDPLNGPWTYTGEILKNPGNFGYPWGNNHSHLQKFGNYYYMIYHTQYLEGKLGIGGGYRGIAINKATVNESTGKITTISMNNAGPSVISDAKPVASDGAVLEAESMANSAGVKVLKLSSKISAVSDIHAGDWTLTRFVTFPDGAKSVSLRVRGKCKVEIRPNKIDASPIAVLTNDEISWKTITADLTTPYNPGKGLNYLYFVFTEAAGTVQFDNYSFSAQPTAVESIEHFHSPNADYYNLNGQRVGSNYRGIIIKNGKKYINK